MKHLLFFFAILLFFAPKTNAQDGKLYWKYKDYDDSKSFILPGILPKMASLFVRGKDVRRLLRHTGQTRVMFFEKNSPMTQADFTKLSKRAKRKGGLEDLVTVRAEGNNVRVMVNENGRRIRKLVFLVQSEDAEFVMVSIKGRFKYNDINSIIQKYNKPSKKKKDRPKIPVKIPVVTA